MLTKAELTYDVKWEDLDWEKVKEFHPLAPEEKPKSKWEWSCIDSPCRFTDQEIAGLAKIGFKFEIVPYPGAMTVKMKDRHKWEEEPIPSDIVSGKAVQITIPDMALLLLDEVTYEDDCCTDRLQSLLDDGWRLLAVCPPNAQRRPDYVLGRRKR